MGMLVFSNLRPKEGSKTCRAWEIADDLSQKTGKKAKRRDVINACLAEGGNYNTASTQYDIWQKAYDKLAETGTIPNDHSLSKMPQIVTTLQIGTDGRLLVPLELRSQMKLGVDGKVTARLEDGELRLLSPLSALQRLQDLIKSQDLNPASIVDELLDERKQDAISE